MFLNPPIDGFLRLLGRESYNYSQYVQGIRPCFLMAVKRLLDGQPGYLDAVNSELPTAEKFYCEGGFDHLRFTLAMISRPGEDSVDHGLSIVHILDADELIGILYIRNVVCRGELKLVPGNFCTQAFGRLTNRRAVSGIETHAPADQASGSEQVL